MENTEEEENGKVQKRIRTKGSVNKDGRRGSKMEEQDENGEKRN